MPRAPSLLDVEIDRNSDTPVYRQLAGQLRKAIAAGVLRQGTRLPPTRDLARQLQIARNTVVEAYAQLAAGGYLESLGRGGTVVTAASTAKPLPVGGRSDHSANLLRRLDRTAEAEPPRLDWRLGQAFTSALPISVWRTACREAGRHVPPPDYGDPRGDLRLREAISRWMRRERSTDLSAETIIVTQGSGHAIEVLARALLRQGDVCAVEEPGYARAARAFASAGARVFGVPVDRQGVAVEQAFQGGGCPDLFHITPAHQYPLGGRLAGYRRRLLLDAASRHGTLIVENEYDHEFVHEGQKHPPLAASDPEHVVLVSTFAKAIAPSFRLGFVTAPALAIEAMASLINRDRLQASWPVQKIAEWLLRSGELERHLRRVRRHYSRLRDVICSRLRPWSPKLTVLGHEGGLHVVLMPEALELSDLLKSRLAAQGVAFDSVADFMLDQRRLPGLIFSYGHMDEHLVEHSLEVLIAELTAIGRAHPA